MPSHEILLCMGGGVGISREISPSPPQFLFLTHPLHPCPPLPIPTRVPPKPRESQAWPSDSRRQTYPSAGRLFLQILRAASSWPWTSAHTHDQRVQGEPEFQSPCSHSSLPSALCPLPPAACSSADPGSPPSLEARLGSPSRPLLQAGASGTDRITSRGLCLRGTLLLCSLTFRALNRIVLCIKIEHKGRPNLKIPRADKTSYSHQ